MDLASNGIALGKRTEVIQYTMPVLHAEVEVLLCDLMARHADYLPNQTIAHMRNTIHTANVPSNATYLNVRLSSYHPGHAIQFVGPCLPTVLLAFTQRVMTKKGPAVPRYWQCHMS